MSFSRCIHIESDDVCCCQIYIHLSKTALSTFYLFDPIKDRFVERHWVSRSADDVSAQKKRVSEHKGCLFAPALTQWKKDM